MFDEDYEAYITGFKDGAKFTMACAHKTLIESNASLDETGREYFDRQKKKSLEDEMMSIGREPMKPRTGMMSPAEYLKTEIKVKGLSIDVIDRSALPGKPIDLISNEGWALRWHTTTGTLAQFRKNDESKTLFFPSCWLHGYHVSADKCTITEIQGVIPFIIEHIKIIRGLQKKAEKENNQKFAKES